MTDTIKIYEDMVAKLEAYKANLISQGVNRNTKMCADELDRIDSLIAGANENLANAKMEK